MYSYIYLTSNTNLEIFKCVFKYMYIKSTWRFTWYPSYVSYKQL